MAPLAKSASGSCVVLSTDDRFTMWSNMFCCGAHRRAWLGIGDATSFCACDHVDFVAARNLAIRSGPQRLFSGGPGPGSRENRNRCAGDIAGIMHFLSSVFCCCCFVKCNLVGDFCVFLNSGVSHESDKTKYVLFLMELLLCVSGSRNSLSWWKLSVWIWIYRKWWYRGIVFNIDNFAIKWGFFHKKRYCKFGNTVLTIVENFDKTFLHSLFKS